MLRPDYEFDADILPDTNFRCINGIYSYRKFYSYQYKTVYANEDKIFLIEINQNS